MAYNNQSQGQGRASYGSKPAAAAPAKTGGGAKANNRVFSGFKNKSGNGYNISVDESITIPAGTRLGVFLDQVTSKKDGKVYDVVNVSVMPERKPA